IDEPNCKSFFRWVHLSVGEKKLSEFYSGFDCKSELSAGREGKMSGKQIRRIRASPHALTIGGMSLWKSLVFISPARRGGSETQPE
ncbi:MAG: hypothetical protein ACRENG_34290, partial [bacterium]